MTSFFGHSAVRRTVSGLAALAMLASSAACGGKSSGGGASGSSPESSGAQQTGDKAIVNSFKAEEIAGDPNLDYVDNICQLGDTGKVLITGNRESDNVMLLTDMDFAVFTPIEFEPEHPENSESYWRTAAAPDGTIYVLDTVNDYGDAELPDYEDPDFDYESFDFDALYGNMVTSYMLYSLSPEGEILTESEITGLDKYKDDDDYGIYLGGIYPCTEGRLIVNISSNDDVYAVMNTDGEITDELDLGANSWFYASGYDCDNNFVYITWGDNGQVLKTIDTKEVQLKGEEMSLKGVEINGARTIARGTGEYRLYVSGSTALYGVTADGTAKELVNWIDSDLNGDNIESVLSLEDGDFIVYENDYRSSSSGFLRLSRRDSSELANTVVLNMGMMYADSDVTARITEFNKTSDKYRIKIQDYSKYDEWDDQTETMVNSAAAQLKLDIISGNAPDMIYSYDTSLITQLASKGVYTDLYDFLGTNGTVTKDQIMPNVISACEIDGKLLCISPTFSVNTSAVKTKFSDKENWTLDEFIETVNNLPDGMKVFPYSDTKEGIFNYLFYSCLNFIDAANGTCSFDSPEFVKILDFCNRFPDEDEMIDWDTATDNEMEAYWNEQESACRNDKALISNVWLSDLRQYAQQKYGVLGDDITLVGYPSDDGCGAMVSMNSCFAIMSNASDKEACWEFISGFFTEDYQESDYVYNLPALKSSFEKKIDDTMESPYWTDENGKKQTYDDEYYIMGESIKIPNLTQEERDYLYDYIISAHGTRSNYFSEDVDSIVREEVQAFFKGQRSAQEAADLIQNRVSILVSEQS